MISTTSLESLNFDQLCRWSESGDSSEGSDRPRERFFTLQPYHIIPSNVQGPKHAASGRLFLDLRIGTHTLMLSRLISRGSPA